MRTAGVILAGGKGRRMGGREKAFLTVGGVPILARIAQTVRAQCNPVLISGNGDAARFAGFGMDMIADTQGVGPMAGLALALDWFATMHTGITHVLSVPSDTPFLPADLAERLTKALTPDIFASCATSGGRLHPVIGLWPVAARHTMNEALATGALSFQAVLHGKYIAEVEWETEPRDPFFNVNTPEDLAVAEALANAGAA